MEDKVPLISETPSGVPTAEVAAIVSPRLERCVFYRDYYGSDGISEKDIPEISI